MTVAILFARADSCYKALSGCDVYDMERDARTYDGPRPVVAHPPCRAWGRLKHMANPRPDERNLARVRGGAIAVHRRNVGVVYQNHQLLMDRSVADNVALPLVLRGIKRGDAGKRVRSILDKLGLAARERALPSQLSAGEQQRVAIARAVVAEPALLIADEPTGNLDPALSTEIMALLAALPERGTSVLVASHDLGLVKRMKKRVLVLDQGRLVDDIAPEDLVDE